MVTDEMVEAAARAINPYSWNNPGHYMSRQVSIMNARAALEAALSAEEPVACEYGHDNGDGTYSPTYARWPLPPHIKPHGDMPVNLFYAAPPAPSVSVKDWSAEIKKLREYRRLAYNTGFLYLADWMEEMASALPAAPAKQEG